MLKVLQKKYHKVLAGQTLRQISAVFCVSEYALVRENRLTAEVRAGQILKIPDGGNLYTAQAGDDKITLCGSVRAYEEKNGSYLYPGKKVFL
ncbi:MAG: hypothetical protein IJY11_00745 [Clostridia bacterium]|nr:hypothetical protein [Clostridia bacterium]